MSKDEAESRPESAAPTAAGALQKQDAPARDPSDTAFGGILVATAVGLVAVLVYSFRLAGASIAAAAAAGVLISGASLLSGGLLGFLFGIPRTQADAPRDETPPVEGATAEATKPATTAYRPNTNLEQISDWLTKILVGVGLTQFSILPGKLKLLGGYLAKAVGGGEDAATFACVLVGFFGVCGFFLVYLWTRLHMAGALRHADAVTRQIGALAQTQVDVQQRLDALTNQSRLDAVALALAQRIIDDSGGLKSVRREELEAAIQEASPSARMFILNEAESLRTRTWRDDKPMMERAIPVLRALVAADGEGKDHRVRAKLGYALKDAVTPDWAGADAALSAAIEIRDARGEPGTGWYEFNRALARVRLDPAFARRQRADERTRANILADLQRAHRDGSGVLRSIIDKRAPELQEWLAINEVDAAALAA